MSEISTSYLGPLGSLIHHFRADARTVTALAALDWTRRFRRVWLDTLREMVVLMSPSGVHEKLTRHSDDVVDAAAEEYGDTATKLGSTRWRGPEEPRGTGLEPDCCFYLGERADAYLAAVARGKRAAAAFVERNAPDLVVEVEITHADETKARRYADLGVREFWRFGKQPGSGEVRAEFRELHPGAEPQPLAASQVLPGLTPEDVDEALEKLGRSGKRSERTKIVQRIVRRRLARGFPVREERAPYLTRPVGGEGYAPASLSAPRRSEVSTSYPGPLGSTIHYLRLDARTVTEIAGLDWDTRFRRVWLDPVRELVVLMEPSRRHDDLTGAFDDLAETAAKALGGASAKLGNTRWRREEEPPDTGIEADGSFYFGERAEGYRAALAEGEGAASAFVGQNAPDLVVEVEMTRADEGKVARYAELGVRELWRVHAGEPPFRADFLSLRQDAAPEPLPASEVLPGLTPEEAGAAVEPAPPGRSVRERPRRAERVLRRRRAPSDPRPTEVEPVAAAGVSGDG